MPWTGQTFAERHNHSLTTGEAHHAARIANAILHRTGDEGLSIATANHLVHVGHRMEQGIVPHRDDGGSLDQGIGGVTPSATTQSPLVRGMIQRYASLPTEKLAELGAQMGGSQQGQLIQKLLMQRRMMPPAAQSTQGQANPTGGQAQSPGAASPLNPAQTAGSTGYRRGGAMKRAGGGDMGISAGDAAPWWTRREADQGRGTVGFLHGTTPGRADQVNTSSPAGSYVFPADVVAGLGEGNSLAGARIMQNILESGPHGIPMPRGSRGMGPPHPPPAFRESKGGRVPPKATMQTPVALSHGEFVATPEHCRMWGGGDIKAGHKLFDRWVVELRADQIKKLKKLPGPVRT